MEVEVQETNKKWLMIAVIVIPIAVALAWLVIANNNGSGASGGDEETADLNVGLVEPDRGEEDLSSKSSVYDEEVERKRKDQRDAERHEQGTEGFFANHEQSIKEKESGEENVEEVEVTVKEPVEQKRRYSNGSGGGSAVKKKKKEPEYKTRYEEKEEKVAEVVSEPTKRRRTNSGGGYTSFGDGSAQNRVVGTEQVITAVVHNGNREIKNGSTVRMRIAEKCTINGIDIAGGTMITGMAKFGSERVEITVTTIKTGDNIVRGEMVIYDNDGIKGIYVPGGTASDIVEDGAQDMIGEGGSKIKIPWVGSFSTKAAKKMVGSRAILIGDGYKIFIKIKRK